MEKINKDLETIKTKLTKENIILGNSNQIIKQMLQMIYNLENVILEMKKDIIKLKEKKNVTKLD